MASRSKKIPGLKLVFVGNGGSGKTTMLIWWTTKQLPLPYTPTIFDNYAQYIQHYGHTYEIGLWDTAGGEDYPRLRPLCYPQTDVFVLLYSVAYRPSFDNITVEWIPELRHHMPNTPIILVGNKIDIRNIGDDIARQPEVSYKEGLALARKHNMSFTETSSYMDIGVNNLFEMAVELALAWSGKVKKKDRLYLYSPPYLPPPDKPPYIHIEESTFAKDMATLLEDQTENDVVFHFGDERKINAHRVILCSASDFFCHLFQVEPPTETDGEGKESATLSISWDDVNKGCVRGVAKITQEEPNEKRKLPLIHICLSDNIRYNTFQYVLRFMYTGELKVPDNFSEAEVGDLTLVADIFGLSHLKEMTECGAECVGRAQLSIARYPESRHWRAGPLFVNKNPCSDVRFKAEAHDSRSYLHRDDGTMIPAHKAILKARSLYMERMFSGDFQESSRDMITLPDTSKSDMVDFMNFIYTDTCKFMRYHNPYPLLQLADKFGLNRLKNLCERQLATELGGSTAHGYQNQIEQAQLYNAEQLVNFIKYFICVHYDQIRKMEKFEESFSEEDLEYFEEHRYPPASYLSDMEEFESFGGGRMGPELPAANSQEARSRNDTHHSDRKCIVM